MTRKTKIAIGLIAGFFLIAALPIFRGGGAQAASGATLLDAGSSVSYDYNSGAQFYSCDSKNFFFFSKDYVRLYSSKGEQIWSETISLSAPIISSAGKVVAVSEPKGRAVYVFDETGKLYGVSFEDPVLSFGVNKSAYLSVILQSGDKYRIELYGKDSQRLWYYSFAEANIFPVSVDASSDGGIVAASFLDINIKASRTMASRITFLYTSASESRKYTDGIFAGVEKDDQIITSVKFMENDKLLAVSDSEINCYAPSEETAKNAWSISLHNKIDKFCVYSDKSFSIATGEAMLNDPLAKAPGSLVFYNMNGSKTGEFALDSRADSLTMSWGCALVGSGRNFWAVTSRGRLLWKYTAIQDINSLVFLDSNMAVIAAGSESGRIMKR
ncbi:MAG: DUF5711 family protein [Clostridiales bacterium]|jgi:hypothetical protein|nr:DUF5711 family protein [Clostridiales bacterium]